MIENEISPITFSNIGDFSFSYNTHVPTYTLHNHHEYFNLLLDANGDVQTKRCIMMDDVFIYHAHTLFALSIACIGKRANRQPRLSTS
jgi:hypothetical protein